MFTASLCTRVTFLFYYKSKHDEGCLALIEFTELKSRSPWMEIFGSIVFNDKTMQFYSFLQRCGGRLSATPEQP